MSAPAAEGMPMATASAALNRIKHWPRHLGPAHLKPVEKAVHFAVQSLSLDQSPHPDAVVRPVGYFEALVG